MQPKYANVADVPLALAVFLASDFYDYNPDPHTISATTLLKPVRQIVLASRVPPGEGLPNLSDMMSSRMGAAIHDGIERAWKTNHKQALQSLGYPSRVINRVVVNPDPDTVKDDDIPVYLENRMSRKIGKWTVTGKFDFIGEGKVQDFKTTSVFTYMKQTSTSKYAQQGSIYRWLDPRLIHQDQMDIHYIFTDWKAALSKTDPKYPPKRFLTQSFDLLSIAKTEAMIRQKLEQIETYWDKDEADIPECGDEDLWRSQPVFKYYKNGDTTAKRSTKNFDSMTEAVVYKSSNGNVGAIKEVPGQVTACKYCPAFAACSQKDRLIASGDLIME